MLEFLHEDSMLGFSNSVTYPRRSPVLPADRQDAGPTVQTVPYL